MLDTICRHLRNYFSCAEMHEGNYTIENGKLSLPFANENDYILIEGSKHNDGIVQWTSTLNTFTDEEFHGYVSIRAIPKAFEDVVADIEGYVTSHTTRDGIASESFGGYSYSMATGTNGVKADWPSIYRERLNVWRKM